MLIHQVALAKRQECFCLWVKLSCAYSLTLSFLLLKLSRKLWIPIFGVFGLSRPKVESEFSVLVVRRCFIHSSTDRFELVGSLIKLITLIVFIGFTIEINNGLLKFFNSCKTFKIITINFQMINESFGRKLLLYINQKSTKPFWKLGQG